MNTLIVILAIISLLCLINIIIVKVKLDNIKSNNSINPIDISQTKEFKEGLNRAFMLVQISLFKMWKENDILDFDNINEDIKRTLIEITADSKTLNKWDIEYSTYMKEKMNNDK